jgi:superfamily I DNA/RNA helicase
VIQPSEWKPADGFILEPNALKAATEPARCLALTAGPGAGKTEMLAQRADFLLRTALCPYPKRILAISFKADASSNLKNRVQRRCGAALAARFDSHTFHAFAKRLIDRFRPVLTDQDALDVDYTIGPHRLPRTQITFNDLVPLAVQILNDSALVRRAVQQTYSNVFLDEFQDCTKQQYAFIKSAFHGTGIQLTAVGDTKQKIMGWAGALEGIFLIFAKDFDALPLNLYRNFRSQPQLLRMQNEIIKVLDPTSVMADDLMKGEGGIVEIDAFDTAAAEATSLAEQIDGWITDEQLPRSEIAVLVSKQPDLYAELLMAELERRNISYRDEQQLQDLATEPAAQLIVDYLIVLLGSREPDAYTRLMARLTEATVEEHDQSKLRINWTTFIKAERAAVGASSVNTLDHYWAYALRFVEAFGRNNLISLSPDYQAGARLDDVIDQTKSRFAEKLTVEANVVWALKLLMHDNAIRIMTIHKSKSLEFDTVIVLGVEREAFWGNVADERCAFFVAISRAKRRLVLTHVDTRPWPSKKPPNWSETRTRQDEFLGYARPFVM